MLTVIFLVVAIICFLWATFVPIPTRINVMALGLAFFAASFLISGVIIVTK